MEKRNKLYRKKAVKSGSKEGGSGVWVSDGFGNQIKISKEKQANYERMMGWKSKNLVDLSRGRPKIEGKLESDSELERSNEDCSASVEDSESLSLTRMKRVKREANEGESGLDGRFMYKVKNDGGERGRIGKSRGLMEIGEKVGRDFKEVKRELGEEQCVSHGEMRGQNLRGDNVNGRDEAVKSEVYLVRCVTDTGVEKGKNARDCVSMATKSELSLKKQDEPKIADEKKIRAEDLWKEEKKEMNNESESEGEKVNLMICGDPKERYFSDDDELNRLDRDIKESMARKQKFWEEPSSFVRYLRVKASESPTETSLKEIIDFFGRWRDHLGVVKGLIWARVGNMKRMGLWVV